MSDILNEAEEDLRRETYLKLWRAYGRPVVGLFVLAVLIAIGVTVWQNRQEGVRQSQSAKYQEILAAEPMVEGQARATQLEELQTEVSGGYDALVRLDRAAALVEAKQFEAAISLFEGVADDGGVEKSIRDVAALKAALLQGEVLGLDEMRSKIGYLAAPDQPLRFTAGELLGYVAFRTGKPDVARGYFVGIRDDALTPPAIRQRAEDMISYIAGQGEAETGSNPTDAEAQEATDETIDETVDSDEPSGAVSEDGVPENQ